MKKEKSVLHLCEGTLLALVILLIMESEPGQVVVSFIEVEK